MQNDNKFPQLIITGRTLDKDVAASMRSYLNSNEAFAVDFIHPTGEVGYIDSSTKEVNTATLKEELKQLAKFFKHTEIAVTLMSGPPGQSNKIVASFLVKDGQVKEDSYAHIGHGPPKRYKQS